MELTTEERVAFSIVSSRWSINRSWAGLSPGSMVRSFLVLLLEHVRLQLHGLAAQLRMPQVVATTGTLMQGSLWDPKIAERRDALVATLTEQLQPGLDLALGVGELETALDAYDASALMVGPVLYRTTMQDGEISETLLDHLLDSLGTWHPRSPGE